MSNKEVEQKMKLQERQVKNLHHDALCEFERIYGVDFS
jgi:hypothetical protein